MTVANEDLAAAVERAYAVFARYRIGSDLAVCHCNCCMAEEVQRELVATPLRSIPSPLLAEYTNFRARPEVSPRIEAAFFAVDDQPLQKILSDALAGGAT